MLSTCISFNIYRILYTTDVLHYDESNDALDAAVESNSSTGEASKLLTDAVVATPTILCHGLGTLCNVTSMTENASGSAILTTASLQSIQESSRIPEAADNGLSNGTADNMKKNCCSQYQESTSPPLQHSPNQSETQKTTRSVYVNDSLVNETISEESHNASEILHNVPNGGNGTVSIGLVDFFQMILERANASPVMTSTPKPNAPIVSRPIVPIVGPLPCINNTRDSTSNSTDGFKEVPITAVKFQVAGFNKGAVSDS